MGEPKRKIDEAEKGSPTPIHVIIPPPPPPPPPPPQAAVPRPKLVLSSKGKKETSPIRKVRSPRGSSMGMGVHCSPSMGSKQQTLFRGVRSRSGKWVSEIREPKKTTRIWLGTYPSPEMAAAAYDVAALALKGTDTFLNFPHLLTQYPLPDSSSPPDIRTAASSAAALKARSVDPMLSLTHPQITIDSDDNIANVKAGMMENYDFIDDEEIFDLPNLLVDMAEGMLLSPPRITNSSLIDDSSPRNINDDPENLWNYP